MTDSSDAWNWAGTHRFTARAVVAARTADDVRAAVRAAGRHGRVRALGTRHSFNDLADTSGTLVTVTGIAPGPVLDEAARTVTVGAGITYGVLAAWLQDHGWALANMGSLPHISVGGATATATHGSGTGNQVLSASVAALEYVDAEGEIQAARRGDPGFPALAAGLGAFGIITRITLDAQPSYQVRQDAYTGLTWDRVLDELDQIMSAAYSVSLFTDWGPSLQAWVKRRLPPSPASAPAAAAAASRSRPAGSASPGPMAAARNATDAVTADPSRVGSALTGPVPAQGAMPDEVAVGPGLAGPVPGAEAVAGVVAAGPGSAGPGPAGPVRSGTGLTGTESTGTGSTGAGLTGTRLTGAGSTGAGSTGRGSTDTGLTGPGLTGAGLTDTGLTGGGPTGTGSTGAGLTGTESTGAGLVGARLTGGGSTGAGSTGTEQAGAASGDTVPAEFFGAPLDPGPVRLADAPADNLTPLGVPGPWAERLPHFRPDSTPSNGDEIQSEFFVDRSDGPAALAAVRALATLITPLLLVTEIRAIAADDLWLSGAYQRDTLAIHFTWRNQPGPVDAVLARVEEALAPFAPRPHWGKVSHLTPDGRYPRLADARAVFERLDPEGRFSNARLERLGVRLPRLPMPSRRGLPAQHPCLRHASAISPLPLSTLAGSRVITFCLSRRDG